MTNIAWHYLGYIGAIYMIRICHDYTFCEVLLSRQGFTVFHLPYCCSNFYLCYWGRADLIYDRIYLHIYYRIIGYMSTKDFLSVLSIVPYWPNLMLIHFHICLSLHLSLLRIFKKTIHVFHSSITCCFLCFHDKVVNPLPLVLSRALLHFFVFTPIFIHVILLNPV